MSEVELLMVMSEARPAGEGETDLHERIRKCMKAAQGHWMVLDQEKQLRGALAAAIDLSEGDERNRLEKSIQTLGRANAALSAMQSGVPLDLDAMLAEQEREKEEGFEAVPIMQLWHETSAS